MKSRFYFHLFFVVFILAGMGCPKRPLKRGPGDTAFGVEVTWFGHSCFLFQDSAGRKVLIDPFDDDVVGYRLPWTSPDIVVVTHGHFDHNHVAHATGYEIVKNTGTLSVGGLEIHGGLAFHDAEEGRRNGTTRFYVWDMGGLRFAHMGDIGHASLTDAQRSLLKDVDVLFLPVGGKTTVDAAGAVALVKIISPRVVIPMHYGNKSVRFFEFDPVEPFLKLFTNVIYLPESDFQIQKGTLPSATTVYVPKITDGK